MTSRSVMTGLVKLVPTTLAMATLALAGCGRAEPARRLAPAPNEAGADERTSSMTAVVIDSGDHRWHARLVDSPSVRDFLAQLPLTLTLKDYAGTEKIADLPRTLTRAGAPAAITPVKGDVAFYAPWGNVAIFYKDGHHSPGLILLGRIEGSTAALGGQENVKVTIRRPTSGSD